MIQRRNKNIVKSVQGIVIVISFSFGLIIPVCAQSVDEFSIKAQIEFQSNNYNKAIEYYSNSLLNNKETKEIYLQRGECFLNLKKYSEALADFLKADSMESNFASFQIAQCQALLGNNTEALQYVKNNLKSKYKIPQRIFKLEKSFESIQKSKEWKDLWKEEWYSPLENSISEITYFYGSGKYNKAIELADALLLKHNNNFTVLHLRGKILFAMNDLESSEKDFSELIRLKPYNADLFAERAAVFFKLAKYNKAYEDYSRALELDQNRADLYKPKAESLWKLGKYDDALNDLKKYISFYSHDQEAIFDCGLINYDKQDYYGALIYFNDLLEKNKKDIRYFVARGNTYLMCKSYKYAEQDFAQALDLNPKTGLVYLNRGIARFEQGDVNAACRDWQKAFLLKESSSLELIEKRCKQQH